jgi:hypothetical protein
MSEDLEKGGFAERVTAAREALEKGDPHEALRTLRWVFFHPELCDDPDRLREALSLLSPVTGQLVGEEAAAMIDGAVKNFDDAEALHSLGYHLIELGLSEVAVAVLGRANTLAPGEEPILTELVAAMEREGRNADACQVLRAAGDLCDSSFLCRYLLAFNSVLSADLDAARELLPSLQGTGEEGADFMANRIEAMLSRADLVKGTCDLGEQDLRGWHYVTTGGILLHTSPYGYDEGMNGRYAYVADTEGLCKLGLVRLKEALELWDESPPWILAPPDRDSQILAAAAEEVLGLPVVEYTPDVGDGLVVVYDLRRLDKGTPPEILVHTEGQLLYAHATCWTDPPPCAPDITTFLYQELQTPWGERMQVGADGQVQATPEDTSPIEVIAARVVEAEPVNGDVEEHDPQEKLHEVLRVMGPQASFRTHSGGRRSPLWEGGPVKSGRFM